MNNNEVKTIITGNNEAALYKELSPKEILAFLENGALYRGFANMIGKVYDGPDAQKLIVKRLCEMSEDNPDSIRKNVSNWFADKNVPGRDWLFRICFALELDDMRASALLAMVSDTGLHYRNPEEVIYAYCLKFGKSYGEAQRLISELLPKYGDYSKIKVSSAKDIKFTKLMCNEFNASVTSEEELESFLEENRNNFGVMHITAYMDFLKMLSYLQDPDKDFDDSYTDYMRKHKDEYDSKELEELRRHEAGLSSRSVEQIVAEFMQMHVPENTSRGKTKSASQKDFSALQKAIKKNWPSESIIFKMKNRDIDVSRKVMLLLHLITEEFEVSVPAGMEDDDFDAGFPFGPDDDDEEDPNARMEIRVTQINMFLERYGMKLLDPGNPFDFLILYSLKASYEGEDEFMSERIESVLGMMFPDD